MQPARRPRPVGERKGRPTPEEILAPFPVVISLPVVWGEMDAFNHVNNIVYFRYFESARIAYFERLLLLEYQRAHGIGPILGQIGCRFKFPLTYPDTVRVGVRVTEIGADRFVMEHVVVSERHGREAARGEGVAVSYDYAAGRKTALPPEIVARIRALEGTV